jgi:hypothetical protein
MRMLTLTLRLCLALTLALTSAHMTVSRVAAGGLTWVELCAGTEVTTVAVDASGAPVKPPPPCPDCVIAASVLLPMAVQWQMPDRAATRITRSQELTQLLPAHRLAAQARGPPDLA